MSILRTKAVLTAAALALAGCSDVQTGALWPSLEGEAPGAPGSTPASAPSPSSSSSTQIQPLFGDGSSATISQTSAPPPAAPGQAPVTSVSVPGGLPAGASPTSNAYSASGLVTPSLSHGTHIGLRIEAMRQDLRRLQNSMALHSQRHAELRQRATANAQAYQSHVAPIYAKLQVGTTPGNPVLTQQWREAELRLNIVNNDIDNLNNLANDVASDASLASYLLDAVRATYGLSGAYEEDHRQLAILEDEVNRSVISVDRLLNEVTGDISRQGNYVAAERANLTALALAIKTGSFFENTAGIGAGPQSVGIAPQPGVAPGAVQSGTTSGGTPLVVIRFDRNNLNYEPQLSGAIRQVLARNPGASFDILAISPSSSSSATSRTRRYAERVYGSLARFGVDPARMRLSAISDGVSNPEVHIYVR